MADDRRERKRRRPVAWKETGWVIRCKNRAVAPENARRRQRPLPRPESGLWLFYQEVSVGVGAGEDAKAQDVGDDE